MHVAKIVELVGSSKKSWEDAVEKTLERMSKTIRNIKGVDVLGHKAIVENGKIKEYRVVMKISFVVED
jgi:flavin-binding protein dodecin